MTKFITIQEVEETYDWLILNAEEDGDCLRYGRDPTKYASVRKRMEKRDPKVVVREYAHRIALLKKLNSISIPIGLEASHLCHMKACIKPDHMSAEPHEINMSRNRCYNESQRLGHTSCFGHGIYPACL